MTALVRQAGIEIAAPIPTEEHFALVVLATADEAALDCVRRFGRTATVLAIVLAPRGIDPRVAWTLLHAGAGDVLVWSELPDRGEQVSARLQRWQTVAALARSERVREVLVGQSAAWRHLVRQVVEVAAFTQASVLIMGESGTGKELIARLIHDLDPRPDKGALVVVDCTTITPELSGSEFFGHERGAFTGAQNARDGAFALANRGTLFLDEIGELPLPLQAQLLRVIQEQTYKRVGSNSWLQTAFRLVCATNRDLEAEVAEGQFRGDLYYRLAGWICRTPALSERREDILPLALHFLRGSGGEASATQIDEPVRQYLLARSYPGNVRDLRRVVARLAHRHCGPGPITIGDIPEDERPASEPSIDGWLDGGFERAIHHAIELGVGLKEIAQTAAETAIRLALEHEGGNLHRAAGLLGVTDRALQMRRANHRPH
ncbi:sigma-54-dependent transcriptional regulator [Thauera sp. WH-1]|uniref:sigma-54-dependent transcriptional regulator n=1 Tax=Thauera sp. WH-1 TaxID=3398230 RepID=UPI0039FC92C0